VAREESSCKAETFDFYVTKTLKTKQVYLRDIFKKTSMSDSTSIIVESPDPLSPAPSVSSTMNTLDNTDQDPAHQEPADGDIQMEYSSDYLNSQSKIAIKTKCL
jgi:hypothetical protein